jgi:hypothetical protein
MGGTKEGEDYENDNDIDGGWAQPHVAAAPRRA